MPFFSKHRSITLNEILFGLVDSLDGVNKQMSTNIPINYKIQIIRGCSTNSTTFNFQKFILILEKLFLFRVPWGLQVQVRAGDYNFLFSFLCVSAFIIWVS